MLHAVVFVTLAGLAAAEFDPELHAKYLTMPESSFIEHFNAQGYSWKMAEYDDNMREKYAACALIDNESIEQLPIQTHDLEGIELPDNFDARQQWPQCESLKEIYDQGLCGSCYTFGTATSASDRTCIHKDVHVSLSEQDFECMKKDVCNGGYPKQAFYFWRDHGLVSLECKPYNVSKLMENRCVKKCEKTDVNYDNDKHFAEKVYAVSNDSAQIKAELVKNGPIESTFLVYIDLLKYKSGVYEHLSGNGLGYHSVRVIGYGVENGTDYWLVANSWGSWWGDHGFFKIKMNQKDSRFEHYLLAGLPKN